MKCLDTVQAPTIYVVYCNIQIYILSSFDFFLRSIVSSFCIGGTRRSGSPGRSLARARILKNQHTPLFKCRHWLIPPTENSIISTSKDMKRHESLANDFVFRGTLCARAKQHSTADGIELALHWRHEKNNGKERQKKGGKNASACPGSRDSLARGR